MHILFLYSVIKCARKYHEISSTILRYLFSAGHGLTPPPTPNYCTAKKPIVVGLGSPIFWRKLQCSHDMLEQTPQDLVYIEMVRVGS